jgi:aryl-alcohol dehydrogenase-like predicted oxidoreductase
MEQRRLGRTGRQVSVVGLGTWQLGADWGDVSERDARAVLDASVECGVTLIDTADVYGDGRSESIIGGFLADRPDAGVTVATKMGRRVDQVPENYVLENFRAWTDRSRRNLGVDTLDLVQLHCPPTAVYSDDAVFDALDTLVDEGAIAAYGVSVERVDEALTAIARPHVATVQIIANAFRLKPVDEVFPVAAEAGVGIIVRVPLASGLLSGKYDRSTTFAPDDHRSYNRDGSSFDVGETSPGWTTRPAWPRPPSSARWCAPRRPRASYVASSSITAVGGQCSCTRSSVSTPRLRRERSVHARKFSGV